jgi:para-nitrobenzyl esterase
MRNLLGTVIAAILVAGSLAAAISQPVKVDGGLVSGVSDRDPSIMTFKGIPFAAPPVGDLRWRAPKQVAPWTGVRRADKFSASCIQNIVAERKPWTYEFMTHGDVSEDCLYLNIWTRAKSAAERRPVYVYLYGGGFSEGSATVPVYDGGGLAKKGLVVSYSWLFANYPASLTIEPRGTTGCWIRSPRCNGCTTTSPVLAAIQIV